MKNHFLLIALFLPLMVLSQKVIQTSRPDGDKFSILGGKPIFVILTTVEILDDESRDREKKELEKNFSGTKVVNITGTEIVFQNQNLQKYKYPNNEVLTKVFYWDGKMSSKPIVYNDYLRSTEYFSEQLGNYKQSSYYTEYQYKLEEIENTGPEKITEKSIAVSDAFSNFLVKAMLYDIEDGALAQINYNFKGIKSIKKISDTKEIPGLEFKFDKNGRPTSLIYDGETNNFVYENGLFKGSNSQERKLIYIDDILYEIQDGQRTAYKIKNGFLIYRTDSYFEDKYTHSWREMSTDGNKLLYREDGALNNTTTEILSNKSKPLSELKVDIRSYDTSAALKEVEPQLWKMRVERSGDYFETIYHVNKQDVIDQIIHRKGYGNHKQFMATVKYSYEYY